MGQATSAGRFEAVDLLSPVRKFWCGDWMHEHRRSTAAGVVLLVGVLTVATGAIHARLYGHDIFFLLDNGWRALHGQRVHVDYASAWGPLTFLLVAAGLAVSRGSVAAVSYANAIAALLAGFWGVWLAAGRSRTLTGIVYSGFLALLVAAPFVLGEAPIWDVAWHGVQPVWVRSAGDPHAGVLPATGGRQSDRPKTPGRTRFDGLRCSASAVFESHLLPDCAADRGCLAAALGAPVTPSAGLCRWFPRHGVPLSCLPALRCGCHGRRSARCGGGTGQ